MLSEPVTSPDQSVFHVAFDPGANPVGPLAASLVHNPVHVEVTPESPTVERIEPIHVGGGDGTHPVRGYTVFHRDRVTGQSGSIRAAPAIS